MVGRVKTMIGSQNFAVVGFKLLIGFYCFQIFGSHDEVIQFVTLIINGLQSTERNVGVAVSAVSLVVIKSNHLINRRVQLDNKDVDATNRYFPDHVINTGGTVWQGGVNLSFGQEYVSLSLSGVYPNHTEVEVVKLFKGRFINEIDIRERRKVIVLLRCLHPIGR